MLSDGFVEAIRNRDAEAVRAALADDVTFRSPVLAGPHEGKELVATILTEGAMKVFEDFRYRDRFESGDAAALIFAARVADRRVDLGEDAAVARPAPTVPEQRSEAAPVRRAAVARARARPRPRIIEE